MSFIKSLSILGMIFAAIAVQIGCSSDESSDPNQPISGEQGNDTQDGTDGGQDSGIDNTSNTTTDSAMTSVDTGAPDAGFVVGDDSSTVSPPALCGNGIIDTGEECDRGIAINATCESLGRGSGAVTCGADCRHDISGCDTVTEVTDPDGFTVNYEISDAINTVGIVTWSTSISPVTEAFIDFGLNTNYGMTAPVDLNEPQYRTLLLGMKGSRDYHFRIVAKSGSTEYKSQDYSISTGPVTNLIQVLELNIDNQNARAGGFIVTSLFQSRSGGMFTGDTGGASGLAVIVDADGDVVWLAPSSISSVTRARMSYDGKYMWLAPAGTIGVGIERISMDGLDSRYFNIPATHDITAVSGNVMAYPSGGFNDCVVIMEITPDGTTKPVFDTAQLWSGGPCHANAIRFSEAEGLYTLSDLNQGDIIMVDRASGELVQRLSDFGFNWNGHQHGHHLLSDSIVIFNNGNRIAQEISLDRSNMQGSEIWRYGSTYSSEVLGDVQRLPNGNTLVTYSTAGRIHEVGPDSNRIAEIRFSASIGYALWRKSLYGPPPDITL